MKWLYFNHVIVSLASLHGNRHRPAQTQCVTHASAWGIVWTPLFFWIQNQRVIKAWINRDLLQLAVVGHLSFPQVTHLVEESQNLRRDSPQCDLNLYLWNSAGIKEANSYCSCFKTVFEIPQKTCSRLESSIFSPITGKSLPDWCRTGFSHHCT